MEKSSNYIRTLEIQKALAKINDVEVTVEQKFISHKKENTQSFRELQNCITELQKQIVALQEKVKKLEETEKIRTERIKNIMKSE